MSAVRILDPRFSRLIIGHANLEKLWTGGRWLEGPVYFPAGRHLIFSDIPNDRLLRFDEMSGRSRSSGRVAAFIMAIHATSRGGSFVASTSRASSAASSMMAPAACSRATGRASASTHRMM